jgi:organic radical activating enzyme
MGHEMDPVETAADRLSAGALPAEDVPLDTHPTHHWHVVDDGRVQCDVCPRACRLHEGQRGFCFVRMRHDDEIVLTTYGRSSGFCVDPIEKKPLNHFLPGTPVLSFGTAGCNLGCRFCQNWDISKSREIETLADPASAEGIAEAAERLGCRSVAFTYNDPVIFMEYAIDVADACRLRGIKAVAVTAGYISPAPRAEFYRHMDAANVDLKGFTEEFYHRTCFAHLGSVLETLVYLKHETDVWFEITQRQCLPGDSRCPPLQRLLASQSTEGSSDPRARGARCWPFPDRWGRRGGTRSLGGTHGGCRRHPPRGRRPFWAARRQEEECDVAPDRLRAHQI